MQEVLIILSITQLFCHLFYVFMKLSNFKRRKKLQVSGTYLDIHWLKGEGEIYMMGTVAVCVNLCGSG